MANDHKKGGRIIYAIYLGPKSYLLKYALSDRSIHTVMKCKGVPQEYLREEWYEDVLAGRFVEQVPHDTFKRVGFSKTGKGAFEILKNTIRRGFIQTLWQGRNFEPGGRYSTPKWLELSQP
jgi:hypothetical protein